MCQLFLTGRGLAWDVWGVIPALCCGRFVMRKNAASNGDMRRSGGIEMMRDDKIRTNNNRWYIEQNRKIFHSNDTKKIK